MKAKRKAGRKAKLSHGALFLQIVGMLLVISAGALAQKNLKEQDQAGEASAAVLAVMNELHIAETTPEAQLTMTDSDGTPLEVELDENGYPVNVDPGILFLMDASGHTMPWPTTLEGQYLSWEEVKASWFMNLNSVYGSMLNELEKPIFVRYPDMPMPTMTISNVDYVGRVQIEKLSLELPVTADPWSYDKLKVAPGVYYGSIYSKDMVIAGHNYDTHFGSLRELSIGDEVVFVDVDGNRFTYAVCDIQSLKTREGRRMIAKSDDYDLTLFTCAPGAQTRVTIRCKLQWYDAALY